jgi:hypothetical protein
LNLQVEAAVWRALIDANLPPAALWPERLYRLPVLQRYPDTLNLAELLLAAGEPQAAAIVYRGERLTYAALRAQAA